MKRFSVLCICQICALTLTAQNTVSRTEYFIDTDPGYGYGTLIEPVVSGLNNVSISMDEIEEGAHILSIRAQDSRGFWSSTVSNPIYVIPVLIQDSASKVEYFIDADPGYGHGISAGTVISEQDNISIPLNGIKAGAHLLSVRTQDKRGFWSSTVSHPFYVIPSYNIIALEYFFDDNDPGNGLATNVDVFISQLEQFAFDVSLQGLTAGEHQLNIRAKGQDGQWSLVVSEPFTLTEDDSGVSTLKWTMPIDILIKNNECIIAKGDGTTSDNYRIEVFSTSGALLQTLIMYSPQKELAIPLADMNSQVIFIKVSEMQGKHYVIKRILAK